MACLSIRVAEKALQKLPVAFEQVETKESKLSPDLHKIVRSKDMLVLKYNGITYGKLRIEPVRYTNTPTRDMAEEAVQVIGKYYQRMLDQEELSSAEGIDLTVGNLSAVVRSQLMMAVYIALVLSDYVLFLMEDTHTETKGVYDGWKLSLGTAAGQHRISLNPVG